MKVKKWLGGLLIVFLTLILILFIMVVLVLLSIYRQHSPTIESYITSDIVPIVEVALCHAQGSETDYFVLTEDGELIVERGDRQGNDFKIRPFMSNIYQTQKCTLSSEEVNHIIDLTDDVYKSQTNVNNEINCADNTEIQIMYEGSVIVEEDYNISPEIKELLVTIAKMSPIEIGYLRSLEDNTVE